VCTFDSCRRTHAHALACGETTAPSVGQEDEWGDELHREYNMTSFTPPTSVMDAHSTRGGTDNRLVGERGGPNPCRGPAAPRRSGRSTPWRPPGTRSRSPARAWATPRHTPSSPPRRAAASRGARRQVRRTLRIPNAANGRGEHLACGGQQSLHHRRRSPPRGGAREGGTPR